MFLGMVMHDYEIETMENNIWTKDKIEPQHMHLINNKKINKYLRVEGTGITIF